MLEPQGAYLLNIITFSGWGVQGHIRISITRELYISKGNVIIYAHTHQITVNYYKYSITRELYISKGNVIIHAHTHQIIVNYLSTLRGYTLTKTQKT